MPLPEPTAAHVQRYADQGYLIVEDAIPVDVLDDLRSRADRIRERQLMMDWRTDAQGRPTRPEDQVIQGMLELDWLRWTEAPFHAWTLRFARALTGRPVALWYDQLLDKPPHVGAPTFWHQDGALMGGDGAERLISCWMPLREVDVDSGCMHFVEGGHKDGILDHRIVHPDGADCSRGACIVDEARVRAAPLEAGGVTFHHGLMPHMTRTNRSSEWRQVLIQRFFDGRPPGAPEP
jgi:ectoine hydroxylase-related dioxygenase (phytanoyl-CoA dioxygenase family)